MLVLNGIISWVGWCTWMVEAGGSPVQAQAGLQKQNSDSKKKKGKNNVSCYGYIKN
jgi:hypothetical protein